MSHLVNDKPAYDKPMLFSLQAGLVLMKYVCVFFLILFAFLAIGAEKVEWPDLSEIVHVAGRQAEEEDIKNGSAVFLLQSENVSIGSPMDIKIPQYAIHNDEETDIKTAVVIIQAEEVNGSQYIGAFDFSSNTYMAGLAFEFTLLGNDVSKIN